MHAYNLILKKLDFEGVKMLVEWAKEEGWNPGSHDALAYWNADKEGFYGFFGGNEMVGGISLVSYGASFGFIGLFIVKPAYRGNGVGSEMWRQALEILSNRLNSGASIGLDGVVDMQEYYKRYCFRTAHRDVRYELKGVPLTVDGRISTVEPKDVNGLVEFDELCFGARRDSFLEKWLFLPDTFSFKLTENDVLQGYAVVRKVNEGYKIGPLFAKEEESAECLLVACMNATVGHKLFLDVPLSNSRALSIAANYGGRYTFECARMYLGEPPHMATDNIFGVTSFELG